MASTRELPVAVSLEPPVHPRSDPDIERMRRLASLLDSYFIDPVIGLLVPGGGDVVGSLLGLYSVAIALRRRMSPVIIARMLLNLGLDALLGIVPLLGDLTDVVFKANRRNLALLEQRAVSGGRATPKDWLILAGAVVAFVATIALVVFLIGRVVRAIGSAM